MNQRPSINISIEEAYRLLDIQIAKGSDLAQDLRTHQINYNAPFMSWLRTAYNAWNHATELVLNAIFTTDSFTSKFHNINDEDAEFYNLTTGKNEIDYDTVNLSKEVERRVEWLVEVRDTYLPIAVDIKIDDFRDDDFVKDLIHPDLMLSYRLIIDKDIDEAIALAFRAVEDKARSAANLEDKGLTSTKLVTKIFHSTNGVLADTSREIGDREGLQSLFAGAMLYYRNPSAHSRTKYERPPATRILLFASELLYEIERAVSRIG